MEKKEVQEPEEENGKDLKESIVEYIDYFLVEHRELDPDFKIESIEAKSTSKGEIIEVIVRWHTDRKMTIRISGEPGDWCVEEYIDC